MNRITLEQSSTPLCQVGNPQNVLRKIKCLKMPYTAFAYGSGMISNSIVKKTIMLLFMLKMSVC